jgi:hypothetical protein
MNSLERITFAVWMVVIAALLIALPFAVAGLA